MNGYFSHLLWQPLHEESKAPNRQLARMSGVLFRSSSVLGLALQRGKSSMGSEQLVAHVHLLLDAFQQIVLLGNAKGYTRIDCQGGSNVYRTVRK